MPSSQQDHDRSIARLLLEPYSTTPADAPLYILPSSAPTNGIKGDIYLNSTTNTLFIHDGTAYRGVPLSGAAIAQVISGARVTKTAVATLTAGDSGALCVFNSAAGDIYTLPVPTAGLWFDFVVTVTATSNNQKVITSQATEFLLGTFVQSTDGTYTSALQSANGTTIRSWVGNGSTTGGIKGDWFRVTAISATQWVIWGMGSATGAEATPFATS